MDRVIVLVDMDCFYVQVEQRANPDLKGKPCAVVQYNTWKGGGIIAVGYEARAKGVTRQMRGNDAKEKCPKITLVRVPEVRGKADLTRYREAGAEVIEVFMKFSNCVERASIDEAYIDLTEEVKKRIESIDAAKVSEDQLPNTHAVGYEVKSEEKEKSVIRQEGISNWLQSIYESEEVSEADKQLAVGATIVEEMRAAVYEETGFRCSAGIAHNKVLAKLACGVNKPNKQTVLPHTSVTDFFRTMPIHKVRGFGGKFGDAIKEILQVEYMAELQQFSLKKLQDCFGSKSGSWVYDICRGLEYESVSARQLPKSVGCSKNFRGREKLDTREKVKHWLLSLAREVVERLEKDKLQNKRKAKSMIVGLRQDLGKDSLYSSRTCAIVKYDAQKFADDAHILLSKFNRASSNQVFWDPPLLNLSMVATKFVDTAPEGSSSIACFMTQEAVAPSQAQVEQSLGTERSKKPSKPKGIELFFSQSDNISKKSKSPVSKLTETQDLPTTIEAVQNTANSASTVTPQHSFFKKYIEKKNAESLPCKDANSKENQMAFENANTTASSRLDNSCVSVNENSLNDFDLAAAKGRSKCDINQSEGYATTDCQAIYDADTDYSDDEMDEGDRCFGQSHEKTSIPVESDSRNNAIEGTSGSRRPPDGPASGVMPDHQNSRVDERTVDPTDNEDMMTCEECGKSVLVWEFPEHADFHFAMKLHQENKNEQRPLTLDNLDLPSEKRKDIATPSCRGRKKAKLNNANMKTLDSFFKS